MKQLFNIVLILTLQICIQAKGQSISFELSEINNFKVQTLNGYKPTEPQFYCEYEIDEKNTQWEEMPYKQRNEIIRNTIFTISNTKDYTECYMNYLSKKLLIVTSNESEQSIIYFNDKPTLIKSNFNLQEINKESANILTESCNEKEYNLDVLNYDCVRFFGNTLKHNQPCIVSKTFPAVNTIFNLYYGFSTPTYFPFNFFLTIDGRTIAFKLKNIKFDIAKIMPLEKNEDFFDCQQIEFQEFFNTTSVLR